MLPKHKYRRLLFVLVLISILLGCRNEKNNQYRIVTIKSTKNLIINNYSRFLLSAYFEVGDGKMVSIPVKNDDVLYFESSDSLIHFEAFARCTPDLPDTITVTAKDTLFYLNNKLVELFIDSGRNMLPWFKQMKESDIKSLRSIMFTSSLRDDYLPWLEKVATINPNIDLYLDVSDTANEAENLNWLANHFKPTILYTNITSHNFVVLQKFNTVKTIMLGLNDSLVQESLPALPSVKELLMVLREHGNLSEPEFLKQNSQLETVTIWGDLDPAQLDWKPLKHLHTLNLYANENPRPYPYSTISTSLQGLQILGDTDLRVHHFDGITHLKELGVSASMSQKDFDQLIKNQPELELLVVAAYKKSKIKDYSVLQQSKHLQNLIISTDTTDINTLLPLKNLKYISLPNKVLEDSVQLSILKKALPNTVITPNSGVCMGSGWLLFVLPLVLLVFLIKQKIFKK